MFLHPLKFYNFITTNLYSLSSEECRLVLGKHLRNHLNFVFLSSVVAPKIFLSTKKKKKEKKEKKKRIRRL